MWGGIDHGQQNHLTWLLQQFANEHGHQFAKADYLDMIEKHLRFRESVEHALNVSQFLDVLAGLSAEAMQEMHSLAEQNGSPPSVVGQQGGGSESQELSSLSGASEASPADVASVRNDTGRG